MLTRFIPSRLSRLLRGPTTTTTTSSSSSSQSQPPSTNANTGTNPDTTTTDDNSGLPTFLDNFAAGAFTGGAYDRWPLLKAALLSSGYVSAFIYLFIAILVNHIRTILCPWLGNWMWYTPMEDLRLALGSPAFFLEYALGFSWWWYAFSFVQKLVWDVAGGMAIAMLTIDGVPIDPSDTSQAIGGTMSTLHLVSDDDSDSEENNKKMKRNEQKKWRTRKLEAVKVGYLVWALATLEHMFARSLNTVTFLIAWYKLAFRGGDNEHLAMVSIAIKNWTRMPLHVSQVYWYTMNALWPIVLSAVVLAVRGQPGMLIVLGTIVGGVVAVIRYRSTVFIALEVSGVFVVMGLLVASAVLLAVEFVEDPLGLKVSTAMARKRGVRARAVLSERAKCRTKILAREEALSLWEDSQQEQQRDGNEQVPPGEAEAERSSVAVDTEKGLHEKTE